ncbi:HPr(Ser) kinase/phosphatase [Archangium primigenium]|uniref:HPr(Ser) kinase/phosphatase n=1 Tax=[Archangium] primigenium TaxID=2792470 RepID=UPI00195EBBCF|nr:HPr(Ser) kinase/phosphatase [Archangium primigenium]MBM7113385.1 HPr kinase/phosphorylase [Archangium primigenium]
MNSIRVSQLLEDREFDLQLTLVAGERGRQRRINSSRIQKPGLALTGFTEHLHPHRVQVFGNTEVSYLLTLPLERQHEVLDSLFEEELACIVVTKGIEPPPALSEACEKAGLTLMRTPLLSSAFIQQVQAFLDESLTESSSLHGVLIDVFGVGILLLGKSGIGKSEIALDLVMRGHRLVADDIVDVTRRRQGVYGTGNAVIRHHMEIRGLGIINVKDLFGVSAVRERKLIELVIELHEWDPNQEYDRLGVEDRFMNIVGVDVPLSVVPVRPGRNMTTIIEVAARNQLLKQQGHHSAREFAERLNRAIAEGATRRSKREEVE